MKMILHILLKDLRRQWREAALFVLVCAAWAWQQAHPGGWVWMHQRQFIPILLFCVWLFIVVRVVQGECLVGDREFWPTRPYRWWQLLAAKMLFCVLVLNVPLLLAQAYLLAHADLALAPPVLFGLLILQAEFFLIVTFTAGAIAAITESLIQWILTIVGLALFVLVLTWLPWDKLTPTLSGEENVAAAFAEATVFGAFLFLIIWQYARRGILPARIAFALGVLTIPIVMLVARTPMVRSMAYPSKSLSGFQLSIQPDSDGARTYTRRNAAGNSSIWIPVIAVPADPHVVVNVEGMKVLLRGDNGWKWESEWINRTFWLAVGSGETSIYFDVPSRIADQIEKAHAAATVDLAYSVYRLTRERKVDTVPEKFDIAEHITCHWVNAGGTGILSDDFACVAPLRLPGILVARISARDLTCPSGSDAQIPADRIAVATQFGGEDMPVEFDLDPVRQPMLNFGMWSPPVFAEKKYQVRAGTCRGTPMTVQTGHFESRQHSTFVLGSPGAEKLMEQPEPTDGILNMMLKNE